MILPLSLLVLADTILRQHIWCRLPSDVRVKPKLRSRRCLVGNSLVRKQDLFPETPCRHEHQRRISRVCHLLGSDFDGGTCEHRTLRPPFPYPNPAYVSTASHQLFVLALVSFAKSPLTKTTKTAAYAAHDPKISALLALVTSAIVIANKHVKNATSPSVNPAWSEET